MADRSMLESNPIYVGAGAAIAALGLKSYLTPEGTRLVSDNKPVTFRQIDPRQIKADPATFQFKSGGDAHGVTDRMSGVTRWDPLSAGKAIVYQRASGEYVIADGHQRRGLALRAIQSGQQGVNLDAYIFRQADGWKAKDVRAIAALKNMKELSGSALDFAKVMRERPDLIDGSLPISDAKVKTAGHLAKLSADAFNSVVGGVVPAEQAAAIGEMVPDRSRHAGLLAEMTKSEIHSAQHARLFVGQAMAVPTIAEHQSSLFGEEVNTRSLIKERAQVLDRALSQLKSDKRIFGLLDREADAIEAAGNRLSHATNTAKAEGAGRTAALLEKLATTHGPVSSYLDEAAKAVAEGKAGPGDASRAFIKSVTGALEAGGINGLTTLAVKPAMPVPDDGPGLFGDDPKPAAAKPATPATPDATPKAAPAKADKAPKGPTVAELRQQAKDAGLKNTSRMNKAALIDALKPKSGAPLGAVGATALATGVVAAAMTAANAAAIAGDGSGKQVKAGVLAAGKEAVVGLLAGAAIGGAVAGGAALAKHVNPTLALRAAPYAAPALAVAAAGLTAYGLYHGGKQIVQAVADRRMINATNAPTLNQTANGLVPQVDPRNHGPVRVAGYNTRDGRTVAPYSRKEART